MLLAPPSRSAPQRFDLDAAAEAAIIARGGKSNFKLEAGYHHTLCTSVNDEVVHGVPTTRVLGPGDIVSVDSGAIIDGWNGDAAFSWVIPDPSRPELVAERQRLSDVTEQSLWRGIARLARARHLNEVGEEIEEYIESQGDYGILTDYVGHGIGRSMHEAPARVQLPGAPEGPRTSSRPGRLHRADGRARRIDTPHARRRLDRRNRRRRGRAHWEHSVAVHKDGIWVLTAEDGGAAGLAPSASPRPHSLDRRSPTDAAG
jgi:methionyl aminopeptidase